MDSRASAHQLELLEILNAYDDMPEDVEAGLLAAIKWMARRRDPEPKQLRGSDHIPAVRLKFQ